MEWILMHSRTVYRWYLLIRYYESAVHEWAHHDCCSLTQKQQHCRHAMQNYQPKVKSST